MLPLSIQFAQNLLFCVIISEDLLTLFSTAHDPISILLVLRQLISHLTRNTMSTSMDQKQGESKHLLNGSGARKAYEVSDLEASRLYHDTHIIAQNEEPHKTEGEFLKPIIFGGLDGILTSFAIVSGAAGGQLGTGVVLILGFSNILADALSMGVGEFLSSKANSEWILSERKREMWEMDNYPEGEIKEMIDIYIAKGMDRKDAEKVISIMSKYKNFFVDVMMAEELKLQVPDDDYVWESFREGVVMFFSFAFFGSLPLLGYILIPLYLVYLTDYLFTTACVITGVVLFIMGSIKSLFSSSNWFQSGAETLVLGGACATIAYTVGQSMDGLVNSL